MILSYVGDFMKGKAVVPNGPPITHEFTFCVYVEWHLKYGGESEVNQVQDNLFL